MTEYFGTTVQHIFDTQEERFRPEGAQGVNAVIAYDITGDGGGQWRIIVKDQTAKTETVTGGDFGDFSVKLTADAETLAGVTLGKIDGTEAFTSGKIKVEGDLALMGVIPKMFMKYTPPKKEITAAYIIGTLLERFRPEKAEGLDMAIGYDLTGDGGGQWTAIVKDGKCELEQGLRDDVTVCQGLSAKDFVDMVLGKLDPMVAMGSGRLRITGNMEAAGMVPRIFKRFVLEEEEKGEELIVLKKTISVDMKYSTGETMGQFLKALKNKKILANVCPECGRKQLPPREACAECRCRAGEFVEVGPEGTVTYLEHVFYASPDPLTGETRETPYGSVHIQLDGCKGLETFWHMLNPADLDDTKRGDRVRPVWAENRTGAVQDITYFEKIR